MYDPPPLAKSWIRPSKVEDQNEETCVSFCNFYSKYTWMIRSEQVFGKGKQETIDFHRKKYGSSIKLSL